MLHGDIQLNGIRLGEWSAVRKSSLDGFNDYECHIKYRDKQGYPCEGTWMLRGHADFNGAVGLAARVLQEGMVKAKRIVPDGSI